MNIEHELQRALSRKPAPPDLADRIVARIDGQRTSSAGWAGHRRWLAAAAAVVLLVGGGARYYEQRRLAAEAERVTQEIRVALQITSEVLARAQARIQETGDRR
jgi:hypothetical protein